MLIASNAGAGMSIGFPDVCKTPVGPATPPIPYPNFALNATSIGFIPNILFTGVPSLVLASISAMTFGQEPGVAHGKYKMPGGYNAGHPNILLTGIPSISLLMPTNGNAINNPVGAKLVPSATTVFLNSAAGACLAAEPQAATADGRPLTDDELEAITAVLGVTDDRSLGFVAAPERDDDGRMTALVVRHVRRHTVAAAVGLQAEDAVLAINGREVAELDGDELAAAWTAEPGDRVTLRVRRAGSGRVVTRTGMQPDPDRRAVRVSLRDGAIVAEVGTCPSDLAWQFDRAVRPLLAEHPSAPIVLDLRGNPGGDLLGALELAGRFVDADTPLLATVDGDGDRDIIRARGARHYRQSLTVVTDRCTASAAESLAGALQSAGRARVVGETTWGKGCVTVALPARQFAADAGTDRLVHVLDCRLPDGRPVSGTGIVPDVPVAAGSDPLSLAVGSCGSRETKEARQRVG